MLGKIRSVFVKKKRGGGIYDISGGMSDIGCSLSTYSRTDACEALFLNRYSAEDMVEMVRATGLAGHCASRGHDSLVIDVDRDDNRIHYFRVYSGKHAPGKLLVDLRISEKTLETGSTILRKAVKRMPLELLYLEWISLQDPAKKFTPERPALPGQVKPGLGAVKYLFSILEKLGAELLKDGFMDVPERIHSAVMYSKKFFFMDPEKEGVLRAILRDLGGRPIHELSWAVEQGAVNDLSAGKPFLYEPSEQIMPVSMKLKRYFESSAYKKAAEAVFRGRRFSIDGKPPGTTPGK
ncbi:MAG: hypothetical protein MUD12_06300 [Spirochaetes bacterium]|nr:hypothetical protein [Spirochaetota bacterium]